MEVGELFVDLIWAGHQAIEYFRSDGNKTGMGDPGTVMTIARFAFLIGAHLCDSFVVGHWIALDGNECGHASHGMDVSAVACADYQFAVGTQKVRGHGDLGAIRKHGLGIMRKLLDEAEDVIPAAAVQSRGMLAKFVEYFVHFEGSEDGFD